MENPENGIQVPITLSTERFWMSGPVRSRNNVPKIPKIYPFFNQIPMRSEISPHMKKL